jgi:predicted PurR-regulated permease PerM
MVVLKKIKSATLIEVIVASLLIVIVFVISSLVLNNLVLNTFSKNTHSIESRLNELDYQIQNQIIKLPYQENYEDWAIHIQTEQTNNRVQLLIEATNQKRKKEIKKQLPYDKF